MPEYPPNPFAHPVRNQWLALWSEDALEPSLPIIDTHHHFSDYPGATYLLDELCADLSAGHRILATVFVEGRTHYRTDGDAALQSVGETEFVLSLVEQAEASDGKARIAAGIVANAELGLGDAVVPALEAHATAAKGRLRGIRQIAPWASDPALQVPGIDIPRGLFLDAAFQRGFAQLAARDLSFDAWLYTPQFDDLLTLANRFTSTRIVADFAPPMGYGASARHHDNFERWRAAIRLASKAENIWLKLGGVGMPLFGFDFFQKPLPPSSVDVASAWRPYFETCIDLFGTDRCMFGSNFPVDKGSFSYGVFWNACKRLTEGYSTVERDAMFHTNAIQFYRLQDL